MTKYVISTMTNSISYNVYDYKGVESDKGAKLLPIVRSKVVIHGGAGMPSARSGFGDMAQGADGTPLWTASGVVTPVSDEKFEMLQNHWLFKKHLEAGRVKVVNSDITGNHKEVKKQVATMEKGDNFAQLNDKTIKSRVKASLATPELDNDGTFRL
jgi:hypothetical protein